MDLGHQKNLYQNLHYVLKVEQTWLFILIKLKINLQMSLGHQLSHRLGQPLCQAHFNR